MAKNKFLSSANRSASASLLILKMKLMQSIKSSGPNIETWGTPHDIGKILDCIQ